MNGALVGSRAARLDRDRSAADAWLSRRRFLALAGGAGLAAAASSWPVPPAEAATWLLHDRTDLVGQGRLYTGSANNPGCDTAGSSDCPGPGRLSAYMGALYVNSIRLNRVRTGTFSGACDAVFPGDGGAERMRWATSQAWNPEYRLVGRLFVYDIAPRPSPYTGLVLHPIHLDNCNNYSLRFWERDLTEVVFGVEADDGWERIATEPMPIPATRTWHSYRVDVLSGSRIRFFWNDKLILDARDPQRTFAGGPVGMRLDYFDAVLDSTRVYRP